MTPIRQAAKHPTVASPARHAAFALLACALSLSSLIARAQPVATPPAAATESDQRARSLFERGRQAYGDGRYRDAWAYFHDSYELSGRPELLYNIGQTADRLGQDADALRAFRMYLQKLPQAPNRHDVENRIHALEDRVSANAQSAPEAAPTERTPREAFPASTRPEPAPPPPRARRDHAGPARTGMYFRGAIGFGLRIDGISDNDLSASIVGFGLALDLAVGYAVLPGLVVGGGLFFDFANRATLTVNGDSVHTSADLTNIGPFVDWYLNRETNGWHIQGALTLSILSIAQGDGLTRSATGIGLVLGGGYEWPIAGDWSVGVLARLTLAGLSADTSSHGVISPTLAATVTWY